MVKINGERLWSSLMEMAKIGAHSGRRRAPPGKTPKKMRRAVRYSRVGARRLG